jgi:hypothetical protein
MALVLMIYVVANIICSSACASGSNQGRTQCNMLKVATALVALEETTHVDKSITLHRARMVCRGS